MKYSNIIMNRTAKYNMSFSSIRTLSSPYKQHMRMIVHLKCSQATTKYLYRLKIEKNHHKTKNGK